MTAVGVLTPVFYEKQLWAYMLATIISGILDCIYAYICNEYQERVSTIRKCTAELLDELSSLIGSLNIFVQGTPT